MKAKKKKVLVILGDLGQNSNVVETEMLACSDMNTNLCFVIILHAGSLNFLVNGLSCLPDQINDIKN